MSLQVQATVRIARTPADVFAFIADPENLPRWDPAIRAVQRTDDGPVGPGSGLTVTAEEAGRTVVLETRVTDFEPGRLFGVSAAYGGVPLRLSWHLEPDGDATRVTASAEAELDGMMAMLGGLIKGMVAERLGRAHANLKRLLEGQVGTPTAGRDGTGTSSRGGGKPT